MKPLAIISLLLLSAPAYATDWQRSPEVERLFVNAGVEGTFVLHDVTTRRFTGYNRQRAGTRFIPASTFKIANTLIGLSVQAVESVDEILPYGGQPQPYAAWEQDMSLRDAIASSNVPVYQTLARRIGLERMQAGISGMDYGNGNAGKVVDRFWLDGPLRISALEQARFLARLVRNELPFSGPVQEAAREILLLEQQDGRALYGKTGWENAPNAGVGWWVGWVQKAGRIHTFALNMDIKQESDAGKRLELGRAALRTLGAL